MKTATRMAAIAVLFAAVLILSAAPRAAASNRYWGSGAGQYYMPLLGNCTGTAVYPANTPLIIAHGWTDTPFITDPLKGAFMSPNMFFEFRIDGVTQKSVQAFRYFPQVDTMFKFYVSEYDDGLTGTHDFLGLWYVDGVMVGGTPHTAVLVGICPVTVAFT